MAETRWQDGPAVEAWMAKQPVTVVPENATVLLTTPRDLTYEELDMLVEVLRRKFGDRYLVLTGDIDVTIIPESATVRAVTHAEQAPS